jgi:hypothetical protein
LDAEAPTDILSGHTEFFDKCVNEVLMLLEQVGFTYDVDYIYRISTSGMRLRNDDDNVVPHLDDVPLTTKNARHRQLSLSR